MWKWLFVVLELNFVTNDEIQIKKPLIEIKLFIIAHLVKFMLSLISGKLSCFFISSSYLFQDLWVWHYSLKLCTKFVLTVSYKFQDSVVFGGCTWSIVIYLSSHRQNHRLLST